MLTGLWDPAPAGLAFKIAGAALAQAATPTLAATLVAFLWPAAAVAVLVLGAFTLWPLHRTNDAAAAALALTVADTRAAVLALQAENRQLADDLTQAKLRAAASTASVRLSGQSATASVARRSPARASKTVVVSTQGTLKWEDTPVTLDRFIQNLTHYQAEAAQGESQLIVRANGVKFEQLNYVLDEARKAGIANLVVESDTPPEGAHNTWF